MLHRGPAVIVHADGHSPPAAPRRVVSAESKHRAPGMRLFAVSDIHTDYKENLTW